jgi:glycosyltransferase involved in cell wall biosynthesis
MKLSVVMPVYNERETIREIVKRVLDVPYDKEVIIVDDASTDGTREILKEIAERGMQMHPSPFPPQAGSLSPKGRGAEVRGCSEAESDDNKGAAGHLNPPIKVFFHECNQGKGAALRTGFGAVGGDVVIIQDADLEYDPQDYPVVLGPILEGKADAVFGSRFLGGPHRVLYFWHYVGNKVVTTFSNMLTNLNLSDMEVGYKAFRAELLKRFTVESKRFGVEPELAAKLARLGCRIYEVPVSYSGRSYAEGKKIGWKDGLAALYWITRYNLFSGVKRDDK